MFCWLQWSHTMPACVQGANIVDYGIKYMKESHMKTWQCCTISLCAARWVAPDVRFHKAVSKDTDLTVRFLSYRSVILVFYMVFDYAIPLYRRYWASSVFKGSDSQPYWCYSNRVTENDSSWWRGDTELLTAFFRTPTEQPYTWSSWFTAVDFSQVPFCRWTKSGKWILLSGRSSRVIQTCSKVERTEIASL